MIGDANGTAGKADDDEILVVVEEPRPGWAVIRPDLTEFRKQIELERIPTTLDRALTNWLAERPALRVRSALGIVEDGFTVALHVWFDAG